LEYLKVLVAACRPAALVEKLWINIRNRTPRW